MNYLKSIYFAGLGQTIVRLIYLVKCKLNLFLIFQSFASCSHLQVRNATKKRKRATGGGRSTQGSRAGSVHGGISVGSSPLGKPRKRHASRAGSVSSVIVSNLKNIY